MDLSPENFERFMNWLHPSRDEAGQKYQKIRALLIKKFQSQGCSTSETLADATIDRTAKTLTPEKIAKWVGEHKERYFYRVAYYILLEEKDKGLLEMQMPDGFEATNPDEDEDLEPKLSCLQTCLRGLTDDKRNLIEKYYRGRKAMKIRNREELARDLKLNLPGLRVRALRIRRDLKKCIERCLNGAAPSRKT